MRWLLLPCAALLVAAGTTRPAAADDVRVDPKAKQFKVQGKFTEVAMNDGDKTEVPVRVPAFFTIEGKKATFRSGGASGVLAANPDTGAPVAAPYGFSLQLTISRLGGDDLLLDLAIENSQLAVDGKATAARNASLATTRKAKSGKPLRIVLEEDARGAPRQWLDLTVTESDE
jgi:hypothetical protein